MSIRFELFFGVGSVDCRDIGTMKNKPIETYPLEHFRMREDYVWNGAAFWRIYFSHNPSDPLS